MKINKNTFPTPVEYFVIFRLWNYRPKTDRYVYSLLSFWCRTLLGMAYPRGFYFLNLRYSEHLKSGESIFFESIFESLGTNFPYASCYSFQSPLNIQVQKSFMVLVYLNSKEQSCHLTTKIFDILWKYGFIYCLNSVIKNSLNVVEKMVFERGWSVFRHIISS